MDGIDGMVEFSQIHTSLSSINFNEINAIKRTFGNLLQLDLGICDEIYPGTYIYV